MYFYVILVLGVLIRLLYILFKGLWGLKKTGLFLSGS